MSKGPDIYNPIPEPLSSSTTPEGSSGFNVPDELIPVSERVEPETPATTAAPSSAATVPSGSTISCITYTGGDPATGDVQNPFTGEPAGGTPPEVPDIFTFTTVTEAQKSFIENLSTCDDAKEKMLAFIEENKVTEWFPVRYGNKYIMVSRDFIKDSSGNYIRASVGGTPNPPVVSAPKFAGDLGVRIPIKQEAEAIFNSALLFRLDPKGTPGASAIGTAAGDAQLEASNASFRENTALNNSVSLVDGHLKTIIKTGMYGGSKTGGKDKYQHGGNPHGASYADYSQGLRFVANETFDVC